MIEYTIGNIFEAKTEALVNPVNCAGVMGKGLALQFKRTFPENYQAYKAACSTGHVQPGHMFVYEYEIDHPTYVRYIVNFPTKRHWKQSSRLEWIEAGLFDLVRTIKRYDIKSIAIPALGCGLGGLSWDQVRPLIDSLLSNIWLSDWDDVRCIVYIPKLRNKLYIDRLSVI